MHYNNNKSGLKNGVRSGAIKYDDDYTDEGRAYIYTGGEDYGYGKAYNIFSSVDWKRSGADEDYAYYGYSVSTAGDVDNNGYDDIMISAPWLDWSGQSNCGLVEVITTSSSGIPYGE